MPRSVIWDYFTKSKTDASKANCTECSKLLSLGSDKPGQIYSDRRSNLLGENAEKLLFLGPISTIDYNDVLP